MPLKLSIAGSFPFTLDSLHHRVHGKLELLLQPSGHLDRLRLLLREQLLECQCDNFHCAH